MQLFWGNLEAQDHESRRPLHVAADTESGAIICLLVQEGADLSTAIDTGSSGEEGDNVSEIMAAGTVGYALKPVKPHESHEFSVKLDFFRQKLIRGENEVLNQSSNSIC